MPDIRIRLCDNERLVGIPDRLDGDIDLDLFGWWGWMLGMDNSVLWLYTCNKFIGDEPTKFDGWYSTRDGCFFWTICRSCFFSWDDELFRLEQKSLKISSWIIGKFSFQKENCDMI